MEQKKIYICNNQVAYTDTEKEAVFYLKEDLSSDEARVFFDQARAKGSAQFEDDNDRQFTLFYSNGLFTLRKR